MPWCGLTLGGRLLVLYSAQGGMARGVQLGTVVVLFAAAGAPGVACGGKIRTSEDGRPGSADSATDGGWAGATGWLEGRANLGGTAAMAGSGGNPAGPHRFPPASVVAEYEDAALVIDSASSSQEPCSEQPEAYLTTSAVDCLSMSFDCGPNQGTFADGCGCGCAAPPFEHSGPVSVEAQQGPVIDLLAECNGPSGLLALFTSAIERMILLEESVYLLVDSSGSGRNEIWSVDKRAGAYQLLTVGSATFFPDPLLEDAVVTSGGVVAYGSRACDGRDGYTYVVEGDELVRIPNNGGAAQPLFQFSDALSPFALIVHDSECYFTAPDGTLWHAEVWPVATDPVLVEQRGAYDDDDYIEVIGMDEDAVYWFAGADPTLRTSDGDPIALYRTCRP